MEWLETIFHTIVSFFETIFQYFVDLINWAFDSITSKLVDLLVYLISVIPDPCCIQEAVSSFTWLSQSLSSGGNFAFLAYFFNLAQFEFGLRIILCAYLARFILRRIPGIG